MQNISMTDAGRAPRLLVVELWGLGDVALAVPFLRAAARRGPTSLLAKPHAGPILRRFCPDVELLPFTAPWTAFHGKYRLHRWPWRELLRVRRELRSRHFACAVSARPDPREHALLWLGGAARRLGFPRAGSRPLLTGPLARPPGPHRADYWNALAAALGWTLDDPAPAPRRGRHVVVHTGAGQPAREWPRERYAEIVARLRANGWTVTLLDHSLRDIDALLDLLATADRFIGNDSGPGHLAALSGVPTFTIFGPLPAASFHPVHPAAAWVEGHPCHFKPCRDYCRFAEPQCIRASSVEDVWPCVRTWLRSG